MSKDVCNVAIYARHDLGGCKVYLYPDLDVPVIDARGGLQSAPGFVDALPKGLLVARIEFPNDGGKRHLTVWSPAQTASEAEVVGGQATTIFRKMDLAGEISTSFESGEGLFVKLVDRYLTMKKIVEYPTIPCDTDSTFRFFIYPHTARLDTVRYGRADPWEKGLRVNTGIARIAGLASDLADPGEEDELLSLPLSSWDTWLHCLHTQNARARKLLYQVFQEYAAPSVAWQVYLLEIRKYLQYAIANNTVLQLTCGGYDDFDNNALKDVERNDLLQIYAEAFRIQEFFYRAHDDSDSDEARFLKAATAEGSNFWGRIVSFLGLQHTRLTILSAEGTAGLQRYMKRIAGSDDDRDLANMSIFLKVEERINDFVELLGSKVLNKKSQSLWRNDAPQPLELCNQLVDAGNKLGRFVRRVPYKFWYLFEQGDAPKGDWFSLEEDAPLRQYHASAMRNRDPDLRQFIELLPKVQPDFDVWDLQHQIVTRDDLPEKVRDYYDEEYAETARLLGMLLDERFVPEHVRDNLDFKDALQEAMTFPAPDGTFSVPQGKGEIDPKTLFASIPSFLKSLNSNAIKVVNSLTSQGDATKWFTNYKNYVDQYVAFNHTTFSQSDVTSIARIMSELEALNELAGQKDAPIAQINERLKTLEKELGGLSKTDAEFATGLSLMISSISLALLCTSLFAGDKFSKMEDFDQLLTSISLVKGFLGLGKGVVVDLINPSWLSKLSRTLKSSKMGAALGKHGFPVAMALVDVVLSIMRLYKDWDKEHGFDFVLLWIDVAMAVVGLVAVFLGPFAPLVWAAALIYEFIKTSQFWKENVQKTIEGLLDYLEDMGSFSDAVVTFKQKLGDDEYEFKVVPPPLKRLKEWDSDFGKLFDEIRELIEGEIWGLSNDMDDIHPRLVPKG